MRTRTDSIAAVALVILWSSGFIGAELGTPLAPAHTLLQWRYYVAVALLVPFVVIRRMRTTRTGVFRQIGLGLAVQCGYLGFLFSGVAAGVPAGVAALIAALQPLVVAIVAGPILGEHTGIRQRIGLGVGVVGVVVVVLGDVSGGDIAWWAYLLPIAAMLSLSAGTVAERRMHVRHPERTPEPLALSLLIQCSTAAVVFTGWGLGAGEVLPPAAGGFWWAVAWLVVLSTFGGLGTYLFVVRRSGATKASVLLYLTPPTTLIWAWLMFGDRLSIGGVAGLAICAVGVWLVLARGKSPNGGDRAIEVAIGHEVVR